VALALTELKFAGASMGVRAGWETCACWRVRKEVSWLSLSRIEQLHGGRVQAAGSPVCRMRIPRELNQGICTNMSS
jgi:hypothetical protein